MRIAVTLIMSFLFLTVSFQKPNDAPFSADGAASAVLVNAETGVVLYSKEADKKIDPAGLKRLPALLAVCRAFDEGLISGSTVITVPESSARVKGVTAFLSANERIEAEELLKASVIISAGDALSALLTELYKSEAAMLEAVNSELVRAGCDKLETDALGTDAAFSANEIARLSLELIKSPSYLKYSSVYMDEIRHENAGNTELVNPNKLVRYYSGCFGVGTGSIGSSEYCGAFIAKRGGTTYLAVVTGMRDTASRAALASSMLDFGFSTHRAVLLGNEGESCGSVKVNGGTLDSVGAVSGGGFFALLPVNSGKLITEITLPDEVTAPINAGDALGSIIIKNSDGEIVGEAPVVAEHMVEKAGFSFCFTAFLRSWLRR